MNEGKRGQGEMFVSLRVWSPHIVLEQAFLQDQTPDEFLD